MMIFFKSEIIFRMENVNNGMFSMQIDIDLFFLS